MEAWMAHTLPEETGPSTSTTPFLDPSQAFVHIESILSVGDQVGFRDGPAGAGQPWRMDGIPDGIGAFANPDGTITVLMNHELPQTEGAVHDHGQTGAFVTRFTLDANTLRVLSADDQIQSEHFFNRNTNSYADAPTDFSVGGAVVVQGGTPQFGRFCSADLAPVSAFFDAASGLGTTERIYLNGEEIGNEGRAFAHIVTGAEAGNSYELPNLGRMAFENSLANPNTGTRTVVMELDDSTPGELYCYVGNKQSTGSAIDRAGLTNGVLYGISASFGDDNGPGPLQGTFTLIPQGSNGDVSHISGTTLNSQAGPLTQFGRPEDGAWDPTNPNRFYFVTTGTPTQPTRLWAMDFVDAEHPELGGTITAVVEGVFSNSDPNSPLPLMMDNITVTDSGLVFMCEDPGNNPRLSRIWMYDPLADNGVDPASGLTEIAHHDAPRFGVAGVPAFGGAFNQDEESSGILEVTGLFGNNEQIALLVDTQAHYTIDTDPNTAGVQGEFVEGGQLQIIYVDLPNPGNTFYDPRKGNNSFDGGFGNDLLSGGVAGDTLLGDYSNDLLNGEEGADRVDGGPGNDTVSGAQDADLVLGGIGNDQLNGDEGNDTVNGGPGDDAVSGGQGDDSVVGSAGTDNVSGAEGNDTLAGGAGRDTLDGGQGDDRLNGGTAADLLIGGQGADTFLFNWSGGEGGDTIAGFASGQDRIVIDLNFTPAQVTLVGFAGSSAPIPASGATLIYQQQTGELFFDPTGDGPTDRILVATLAGLPQLGVSDVVIV
jgi:RTX calcium-binding nonapeptide repeat (4 copies)